MTDPGTTNTDIFVVRHFLFTSYQNLFHNFAKAFLCEALHQLMILTCFFGLKAFKEDRFVNKAKLYITKIPRTCYFSMSQFDRSQFDHVFTDFTTLR